MSAQTNLDSIINQFSFINQNASVIEYSENLLAFKTAILNLKLKKESTVNIFHIGDSHVQAGFYSEPIKYDFQSALGNAGRGIVFPYQAAGTNGPADYYFGSNVKWISKRNATNKNSLPTGITGHAIYNNSKSASLEFRQKDTIANKLIERITIFHASTKDSNYVYLIKLSNYNNFVLRDENESNEMISIFNLPIGTREFTLLNKENSDGISSTIYGALLESNDSGIIVNSIGVNGAEYKHYLKSKTFFQQLNSLKPDLIILSLGTNEAYNASMFEPTEFSNCLDSFFIILKSSLPKTSIIITAAPAVQSKIKLPKSRHYLFHENKNIQIVNEILKLQAEKHQFGFWNFYVVMGGQNSMKKWANAGLTDSKMIHFSKRGYLMQGKLLSNAILKAIND
jgi:lysophospholipase L1-like esterase